MKKFLITLTALALLGAGSGVSFADEAQCPPGQSLRKLGNIVTGASAFGTAATASGGTITTQGAEVRKIIIACGGTACTNVGIADIDTIGSAAAADYVLDPTLAANTTLVLDFLDTPLVFSTGISVGDPTTNTASVAAYACQVD